MPRKKRQKDSIDPQNSSVDMYQVAPDGQATKAKRGAGFYIGIIIAALAIVAALVFGVITFMNSTQIFESYRSGNLGQLDGKSEDEIRAELNKIVEEGMFNISIAGVVDLPNGSAEGEFRIENSPANKYDMQVTISRRDNGEVIYTSGVLEPNYHIQYARLDEALPAGTYDCVATFSAIDPETQEEIGQAAAGVTIVVRN